MSMEGRKGGRKDERKEDKSVIINIYFFISEGARYPGPYPNR